MSPSCKLWGGTRGSGGTSTLFASDRLLVDSKFSRRRRATEDDGCSV